MDKMPLACQAPDTESIIGALIMDNPEKVKEALKKESLIGWFVGQVMKESHGMANPQIVHDRIREIFDFLQENGYGSTGNEELG